MFGIELNEKVVIPNDIVFYEEPEEKEITKNGKTYKIILFIDRQGIIDYGYINDEDEEIIIDDEETITKNEVLGILPYEPEILKELNELVDYNFRIPLKVGEILKEKCEKEYKVNGVPVEYKFDGCFDSIYINGEPIKDYITIQGYNIEELSKDTGLPEEKIIEIFEDFGKHSMGCCARMFKWVREWGEKIAKEKGWIWIDG